MRIRSTKPEFWRSADVADLDFFTRLLFIGLWNYVDDNGVGEDNLNLIRSDLFPRDPIETVEPLVRRGLTELSLRAQIVRYQDRRNGRRYFKVINWHHQKINRPTASKKPLPTSEDAVLIDDSLSDHGGITEDSLADQGNKGTREQGTGEKDLPDPDTSDAVAFTEIAVTEDAYPDTFKSIYPKAFEDWWDHYPRKTGKRNAFKAWQAARKRASDQQLIDGAQRYAADPNRTDQFTKYPEGWLSRDGWLDAPLPAAGTRNGNHSPVESTADLRVAQVQALKNRPPTRLELE